MNRRKITEIVKFNVEKNIQSKGFIILNILLAIIIIVSSNLDYLHNILKEHDIDIFETNVQIEVIDNTGFAKEVFDENFKDVEGAKIEYVEQNNYTKDNIQDETIIVQYDLDDENIIKTTITSKAGLDEQIYFMLENVTKNIRTKVFAEKNDIELSELEVLDNDLEIERVMLGVDAEDSDRKQMIKTGSIFVVYFVLIYTLSLIANEIANEKVSKSIEYVLTSVEAKEYLLAKVLGITITIVIQALYSLVYFLIGTYLGILLNNNNDIVQTVNSSNGGLDMSTISYILVLTAYVIFTVFFMAMIQAALSSKTTSISEAGSTTMILLMVVIVLYFISLGAISPYNKVSTAMYIISCIPIVSTFFVPSMMIIGQATVLQIVISFVLLIIATPIVFNICGKKFKDGILDYTVKNNKFAKRKKERTQKEEQEYLIKTRGIRRFSMVLGLSMIIWLFMQQLGMIIIPPIVEKLCSSLSEKSITWIYFGIVSAISLFVPYKFIGLYTDDEYKQNKKVDFKNGSKYILIGICIIYLIQCAQRIIMTKIGSDYNILQGNMLVLSSDTLLDKVLFVIGLSIIPGIFEELYVRKGILRFGKKYGNYFALIVSALVFGLLHMNLQQGIFATILGLVFGIIYLKTGDIKITIILHVLNNGLVGLLSILENETIASIINIIVIIFASFGGLLFILELLKNKGLKIDKEKFKEEYKMLFANYTFDIVIILFVIITIVSETYLRIL